MVWLDQLPVAAIHTTINAGTPSTRVVYLSTDYLHTPRLAREAGTGTVWRWNAVMGNPTSGGSNAFGDQPASGVGAAPFTFDLRFPGQRLDAESGLHYNYFRDYEAGIGRYVESDPIGLEGGFNTFVYVDGDPLSSIDVYGLKKNGDDFRRSKCVSADWALCRIECLPRKVVSCRRNYIRSWIVGESGDSKSGWVKGKLSCECEDSYCDRNPGVCAAGAAAVAVGAFLVRAGAFCGSLVFAN